MDIIFVDVREPHEYAAGHVEDAVNVPMSVFVDYATKLDKLTKTKQIVLYCRSGARAETAKQILTKYGITNVTNGINQENIEKILNTA